MMNHTGKSKIQVSEKDHYEDDAIIDLTDKVHGLSENNDKTIESEHMADASGLFGIDALKSRDDIKKNTGEIIPGQFEKAMERVIEKMFSEKIDGIIVRVIEKVVKREIDRIKSKLFEDASCNDFD